MDDGRILRVLDTRPADGQAVLVCHGTPASRRLHDIWVTAAAIADDLGLDRLWAPMMSPPDRAVFDTQLAEMVLADWRTGLTPGVGGWVDDYLALVTPLGRNCSPFGWR